MKKAVPFQLIKTTCTPAASDFVNWPQLLLASSAFLHNFEREHPSLHYCGRERNKLHWMFLLIVSVLELLEVKAKASMCHPSLMHGRYLTTTRFQSYAWHLSEKSEHWHSSAADRKGEPSPLQHTRQRGEAPESSSQLLFSGHNTAPDSHFAHPIAGQHGCLQSCLHDREHVFRKIFSSITLLRHIQTWANSPGSILTRKRERKGQPGLQEVMCMQRTAEVQNYWRPGEVLEWWELQRSLKTHTQK